MSLGKFSYFDKRELIIFLAVESNKHLESLVEEINNNLQAAGFGKEKRKYKAHLTLGRGKRLSQDRKEKVKKAIRRIPSPSFSVLVKEISLFNSRLTAKGAFYEKIASFSLMSK